MIVSFIRHGSTPGNELKRYIGRTDESLSTFGIEQIKERIVSGDYPKADIVIHSGMKRAKESAELIYGSDIKMQIEERLRECDFGSFEGKNYKELSGDEEYQRWIDSNGTLPFPQGEDIELFKERCVDGFKDCIRQYHDYRHIVFCVHGGTIMAILSCLAEDAACNQKSGIGKTYYDYHCDNGECVSYQVCISNKLVLQQIKE